MDTKDFQFKLSEINDTGTFSGVASVYGNTDSYGDVVESGAFTKTLGEKGSEIPLLYQHHEPIGKGILEDSKDGLLIRGEILRDIPDGAKAYSLAKAGIVKGLSIGYQVIKDQWDSTKKVRRLLEVKLYEVSLVTFPANELAGITSIKGLAAAFAELKAGRTLSAATRARVEQAITDLQALLAESDSEAAAKHAIEPGLLHSMLTDWRNARTTSQ